ncbi:MAG: hypothetical protein R2706_00525 [Acidimicrobiales bacterium]
MLLDAAKHEVTSHASSQVDDDVGVAVADPLDHLGVVLDFT